MRKAQCAAKIVKIGSKDLLYFHLLKNFKSINMSAEDWKGIVKVIRKDIDDVQQASKVIVIVLLLLLLLIVIVIVIVIDSNRLL